MIKEFILNHRIVSGILFVGACSLVLQMLIYLSLKGYVKASANMKTTKKKILLNLKNQFETIYSMDYQVNNASAYVDKYLLKLRFLGIPYTAWEQLPFLTAGIVTLLAAGGAFYEYVRNGSLAGQIEILFAYGIVLACLFVCFHILNIKSRKQQIQIQLVDYLENYLSNRLTHNREEKTDAGFAVSGDLSADSEMEEDMMMLKRLLNQMENGKSRAYTKRQAEDPSGEPAASAQQIAAGREAELDGADAEMEEYRNQEQSDLELLEEFVQSFLA